MYRCWIVLSTIFLCLLPVATEAQQTPSEAQIKAAIAKLGSHTDDDGFTQFEVLYKSPRRSTELLLLSLEPVRHGQYVTGKHPQVVWNIRALRALTGLDFRAATSEKLDDDEAHFLG